MNTETAKYATGARLYFRPSPIRVPHGTIIGEGIVTVVEVVDHMAATAYSPRFTYVVRAQDGQRQGTDDRELAELCADCDEPAVAISAPEYSASVDTTPKPRCKRHARPDAVVMSAGGAVRETVWCEAHPGVHFERLDCQHPHFTSPAVRDRMNAAEGAA